MPDETSAPLPPEASAPGAPAAAEHVHEPHSKDDADRLNALRAAVLGANDGLVSTAGLVVGVASANPSSGALITAGMAGLAAGALSMAVGEYVSVSAQRDTEAALIEREKRELAEIPDEELEELTQLYVHRGLTRETAEQVAAQLTAHDALAAHAEVELGIDPDSLTNPWHAAFASAAAFTVGSLLPLLTILLVSGGAKIPVTFVAVVIGLILTGYLSARAGEVPPGRPILRNVLGGVLAMAVTFGIGRLVGHSID